MVRIAIIGAGQMGVKIAGELAYHGHRVKMYDLNNTNLNRIHGILEEDKKDLHSNGLLPQAKFLGQVFCMSRLEEAVQDAELVVEAVIEDLKIKQDLFERISHCCSEKSIITSNTLRLNINEINERTVKKERTLGLRFLFPVYCIPEVEVCPATDTSSEVVERVRKLLEKMGKTLYFRSGSEPLILTEIQREQRRRARQEEILSSSGVGVYLDRTVPALLHKGNLSPNKVQDEAAAIIPSDLDRDCAICMDRVRDCLLAPCHHMVTCYQCGEMLLERADACPVCRKDIVETVRVFHT